MKTVVTAVMDLIGLGCIGFVARTVYLLWAHRNNDKVITLKSVFSKEVAH